MSASTHSPEESYNVSLVKYVFRDFSKKKMLLLKDSTLIKIGQEIISDMTSRDVSQLTFPESCDSKVNIIKVRRQEYTLK